MSEFDAHALSQVTREFNRHSEFRAWVNEKFMEHKDELMAWENRLPEYDAKYYFSKHKWMLRKMFQEEKRNV